MNFTEYNFECIVCHEHRKTLISKETIPINASITYRDIILTNICSRCQQNLDKCSDPIVDVEINESTKEIEPLIQQMYM